MKFNKFLAVSAAVLAFSSHASAADIWSGSFSDMGVDYTLTFESQTGNVGVFELSLVTDGYNQKAGAYLDSVSIKAWTDGSADLIFSLSSGPTGVAWNETQGSISSGPASSAGCGSGGAGFACVEAATKGQSALEVSAGTAANPFVFRFQVTANSFLSSVEGAHVAAGYTNNLGAGSGYGVTSYALTTPVPEPEIYAMMAAGLGLMSFVARRRKQVAA